MVTFEQIGEMAKAGDVAGLTEAFSLARDWDSRETIMVGFSNMPALGQAGGDPAVRQEARSALRDILSLCKAESSGGSYRDNCIRTANGLLEGLEADGA